MTINFDILKVSKYVGAFATLCGFVWGIIQVVVVIVRFVDLVYNLDTQMKDRYTRQEVDWLVKYKIAEIKE